MNFDSLFITLTFRLSPSEGVAIKLSTHRFSLSHPKECLSMNIPHTMPAEDMMDSGVRERLQGGEGRLETGLNRLSAPSSSNLTEAASPSSSSSVSAAKSVSSSWAQRKCLSVGALLLAAAVAFVALVPSPAAAAAYRPGAFQNDLSVPSCPISAAKNNFDLSKVRQ